MVERPVSGSSAGRFLLLVKGSYTVSYYASLATWFHPFSRIAAIGIKLKLSPKSYQRAGPLSLLRLLSAPDGLAGDAKGPRHRGLGIARCGATAGRRRSARGSEPLDVPEPAFLRRPPNAPPLCGV